MAFKIFSVRIFSRFSRWRFILLHSPRLGANTRDITAIAERLITIHGPVGILGAVKLMYDPTNPDNIPAKPAIKRSFTKFSVHERAAAAGVIIKAAINTTPTACIPVAMAKTVIEESTN